MIPTVYLPEVFFETAMGAIMPIVAIDATLLGASVFEASIVMLLLCLGQVLADIPAGKLASIIGDRLSMMLGALLASALFLILYLTNDWIQHAICIFVLGAINAIFMLARQSYVTEVISPKFRARALTTLGGVIRIGIFLGPLFTALLTDEKSVNNIYLFASMLSLITLAILIIVKLVYKRIEVWQKDTQSVTPISNTKEFNARNIFQKHYKLFMTLGIAVLLISLIRAGRQTGLPLLGQEILLNPQLIALVYGISGFFEVITFYPAGKIMDTFGRLYVAIPSMIAMTLGMFVLVFTADFWSYLLVAAFLGIANGTSSGIVMTLGADVAPVTYRTKFLSIWSLLRDTGNMLGPLTISLGIAIHSLSLGIGLTAGFGIGATMLLIIYVPKYSAYARIQK